MRYVIPFSGADIGHISILIVLQVLVGASNALVSSARQIHRQFEHAAEDEQAADDDVADGDDMALLRDIGLNAVNLESLLATGEDRI
jgi:hypothetical protein